MRYVQRPLDNPIDSLFEALELLVRRNHRSSGYLCLKHRHRCLLDIFKGPRIVREHAGGWGGMEVARTDEYFVTERIARALELDGYTQGKPRWGYTDQDERHVTDYGEREFWRMYEQVEAWRRSG